MEEDKTSPVYTDLKSFTLDENANRRRLYQTIKNPTSQDVDSRKKSILKQIYGTTNWILDKKTFDGKVKLS